MNVKSPKLLYLTQRNSKSNFLWLSPLEKCFNMDYSCTPFVFFLNIHDRIAAWVLMKCLFSNTIPVLRTLFINIRGVIVLHTWSPSTEALTQAAICLLHSLWITHMSLLWDSTYPTTDCIQDQCPRTISEDNPADNSALPGGWLRNATLFSLLVQCSLVLKTLYSNLAHRYTFLFPEIRV